MDPCGGAPAPPLVIAHRGASAYLPEHTLEAKVLAYALGADYIEQDVVLSRDGVPVVLHDIHLDDTSDVERRFPARARADGRFYALDFTLEELRQLNLHERSRRDAGGAQQPVFPQRFPLQQGLFRLPSLREEIELLAGLDRARRTRTGLYIELKSPNWHAAQGCDLAAAVLAVLEETGYATRGQQVFLQCFDDRTLLRLKREFGTPLPLIQLLGENDWGEDSAADYTALRTEQGLAYIASYADGIGPWLAQVVELRDGALVPTALTAMAHRQGLLVHPYTLRADALPEGVKNVDELHRVLFEEARVDGLFTDFPDLTAQYLRRMVPVS